MLHLRTNLAGTQNSLITEKGGALHAIKHFTPTQGLTAKETLHCPGAIAGNQQTLLLIEATNAAKTRFKKIIANCRAELKQEALPFVHKTLAHAGFTAIKLLQERFVMIKS